MAEATIILGAGILIFIFSYILFKLSSNQDEVGRSKHMLLQVFLFFMIFILVVLIGKATYDAKDNCAWLVDNSTVSGSVTTYGMSYQCSENENNTPDIFYKVTTWFFYFSMLYLFLYFTYEVLKFLGVVVPKEKRDERGKGGEDE